MADKTQCVCNRAGNVLASIALRLNGQFSVCGTTTYTLEWGATAAVAYTDCNPSSSGPVCVGWYPTSGGCTIGVWTVGAKPGTGGTVYSGRVSDNFTAEADDCALSWGDTLPTVEGYIYQSGAYLRTDSMPDQPGAYTITGTI
jgi:hypothetical protein